MLKINHLSFSFSNPEQPIFHDFSLELSDGELLAVMGASGRGKTTLLDLIAGLKKPNAGQISLDAKRISYVFQEPCLFPWLTVEENLLAVQKHADKEKVAEALKFVGLEDVHEKHPQELSGGMKMRVSIARAILYRPCVYLLDEPFAALDEDLRNDLALNLRNRLKKQGASAILVTHDQATANLFADRIIKI